MGTYYPAKDDPYFDASQCPSFWQHHKIRVVPVEFSNEEYYDNIKIAAMTGMGFNIIGVIISSVVLIITLLNKNGFKADLKAMLLKEKLSARDSFVRSFVGRTI